MPVARHRIRSPIGANISVRADVSTRRGVRPRLGRKPAGRLAPAAAEETRSALPSHRACIPASTGSRATGTGPPRGPAGARDLALFRPPLRRRGPRGGAAGPVRGRRRRTRIRAPLRASVLPAAALRADRGPGGRREDLRAQARSSPGCDHRGRVRSNDGPAARHGPDGGSSVTARLIQAPLSKIAAAATPSPSDGRSRKCLDHEPIRARK